MSKKVLGVTRAAAERSVEQCIALIDYDALNADEISFRVGDVINVTGKGNASGFWEGYVAAPTTPSMVTVTVNKDGEREVSSSSSPAPHTQRGLFPNCLVTSNMRFKSTMANSAFQNIALCLFTYQARGELEMSFGPGDVITALRPSGSPGWWYGIKSSGPAWTAPLASTKATRTTSSSSQSSLRFADPAGGVTESANATMSATASSSVSTPPRELLFPTNFVTCDVVLIIFSFVGRQAHELSCKSGDVVQVHRRWNDGWWEGTLRDCRGIFPSNYSVPNVCTTSPPLFCGRCRSVNLSNTFQSACATCAAEERVEDLMLQSLEAYVKGTVKEYDLFAGIDIGVSNDGDGVRGEEEKQHETNSAEVATANPETHRSDKLRTAGNNGKRSSNSFERQSAVRPRQRVTLLTEKDLADLASNRVKLME